MADLLEQDIDKLYKRLKEIEKRGLIFSRLRRFLAYSLKIIVVLSGLAVGSGKFKPYDPAFGFAASIALVVDQIFSNVKRLIAEVAAGYAAKDQSLDISSKFNREKGVLQLKSKQGTITEAEFNASNLTLDETAHKELQAAVRQIEDGLKVADLEALKGLILDTTHKL
jgi:hypothetical protein